MKLLKTHIVNYRSIEEISIEFSPSCRVLVGINESGKSNILTALSTLSLDTSASKGDLRIPGRNEDIPQEGYIEFELSLNEEDINNIISIWGKLILTKNLKSSFFNKGKKKYDLTTLPNLIRLVTYRDDFLQNEESIYVSDFDDEVTIENNWRKPSDICPSNYMIKLISGAEKPLEKLFLVNTNDYPEIPTEFLADIDMEYIASHFDDLLTSNWKIFCPRVISWSYNESNILPHSIGIKSFIDNPAICQPLKNMFFLAGYSNINEAMNEALSGQPYQITNLLNRVAQKATEHFHSIWKEYKGIEFTLSKDGENIIIFIKDKFNLYAMEQRSDGFKRFVSFLLLISARVKSKQLEKSIILIDEPDTSLHPSGATYLRDELLRVAEKNIVVYSTHSIFMIDKNIERHIIVEKENEKTMVKTVDSSNVVEEEVIYKALNFSVFSILNEKNILFEGWRDKHLFKIATDKIPTKFGGLKGKFKNIGICHGEGVKHIKLITPLFEAARREVIIISDSDKPAEEKQGEYKKIKGYGDWMKYDDVFPGINAVTGEDFIKEKTLLIKANGILNHNGLPNLTTADISKSHGFLKSFKDHLKKNGVNIDNSKIIEGAVKDAIFSNLTSAEIDESYYEFLEKIVL